LLLRCDGGPNVISGLIVYQRREVVPLGEPLGQSMLVLIDPTLQIVRYARVEAI